MSNVATTPPVTMNASYAQVNQPSASLNQSHAPSVSANRVNTFLVGTHPTSTENNLAMNKASLEKLFAMFEFAVNAMRNMLASMGVLPKLPGELNAQPRATPGLDAKDVAGASTQAKVVPDADAKARMRPGQVTIAPEGALTTAHATTFHPNAWPKNKPTPDINVAVQVQHCPCPHTDETHAPQRQPLPLLDKQSSPQTSVAPALETPQSPQSPIAPTPASQRPLPSVTPPTVEPMPEARSTSDLTSPAPDGLGERNRHSLRRADHLQSAKPAVRPRF